MDENGNNTIFVRMKRSGTGIIISDGDGDRFSQICADVYSIKNDCVCFLMWK